MSRGEMKQRRGVSQSRRGYHRQERSWTPAMDALLREAMDGGVTPGAIAELLFQNGFGRRSADAVRARAERLDLASLPDAEPTPVDCRASDGADPLVAALLAAHKVPPANVRPSRFDGERLNWRALQPVGGCAGSPAAMCAE